MLLSFPLSIRAVFRDSSSCLVDLAQLDQIHSRYSPDMAMATRDLAGANLSSFYLDWLTGVNAEKGVKRANSEYPCQ